MRGVGVPYKKCHMSEGDDIEDVSGRVGRQDIWARHMGKTYGQDMWGNMRSCLDIEYRCSGRQACDETIKDIINLLKDYLFLRLGLGSQSLQQIMF